MLTSRGQPTENAQLHWGCAFSFFGPLRKSLTPNGASSRLAWGAAFPPHEIPGKELTEGIVKGSDVGGDSVEVEHEGVGIRMMLRKDIDELDLGISPKRSKRPELLLQSTRGGFTATKFVGKVDEPTLRQRPGEVQVFGRRLAPPKNAAEAFEHGAKTQTLSTPKNFILTVSAGTQVGLQLDKIDPIKAL